LLKLFPPGEKFLKKHSETHQNPKSKIQNPSIYPFGCTIWQQIPRKYSSRSLCHVGWLLLLALPSESILLDDLRDAKERAKDIFCEIAEPVENDYIYAYCNVD